MKRVLLSAISAVLMSGAAFAADVPEFVPPPEIPPPEMLSPIPIAFNWSGFYIGLQAAYAIEGENDWDPVGVVNGLDGWIGGATAGAQYQWGSFVLGAEVDIGYSTIDGWDPCPNPAFTCETEIDWVGSARGRLGYAWDRLLFFVTGGVAFAGADIEARRGARVDEGTSESLFGWTAGAGVEWAIRERLSAKIEYAYYDFGEEESILSGAPVGIDVFLHTVRVGLNWRF